jgi:hypothetical protein
LCLIAAKGSEGDEKNELLGFSLSVLLPITQSRDIIDHGHQINFTLFAIRS